MLTALLLCAAGLLAVAALAALGRGGRSRAEAATIAVYGGCLAVSTLAFVLALAALLGGASAGLTVPLGLPWLGAHFRLDALSAAFLVLVTLGAAGASLYALGYGLHAEAPLRVLPFYPLFLAGMLLVPLADDAYAFLLCWELMSLASWALVLAEHRPEENARAGFLYIVMASFGTLALLLAFGLLAGPEGRYAFAAMREAERGPLASALVLALAILGAGSKAGLVPLHAWLPLAHPAAPSHVSALMSGVMTKVAVYAFVRIVFDLLGPPAWWWSVPVLALGASSAVLGVLHALTENDLKRLLAYSTIENIGVVFLGLGLALAFRAGGQPAAAALALAAALFHAFNHTLFKSALFYGAGAVLTAARGERNIERLGGLIRRMPVSSAAVLVAAMAAAALPPLNGFASEWLAFQAILLSPDLPQWALKFLIPTVGTLLALAAALAASCFLRAYGIAWLGRPRSAAAAEAEEVDRFSRAAMTGFGALCVLFGLFPGMVLDALAPVTERLLGARMPAQLGEAWLSIVPIADSRSSYNGLLVFLFVVASAAMAAAAIHRFASRALRRAPPWDCGFPGLAPSMQYTGTSLSQPLRRVFGPVVFRAREVVEMPLPGSVAPARIVRRRQDLVWEFLYVPIGRAVGRAAELLNHLQFLTIRRYLVLVFLSLVLLLLGLGLWR
ncbi:hydrogenase 4 subunit B [Caldovatus aquaticus]|uniref:Hydrogenase 4 subunit B n=1 Tax=Caldovatus aquaticus TaxID=2865671 RepID=A0ABS7F2W6_9PROT|nr:hydrogenase 4 subunit B [Caldovatus aquaticus]MBW8269858.1 hydrogenase 4 subunit B [Caldovatus aquaticus]